MYKTYEYRLYLNDNIIGKQLVRIAEDKKINDYFTISSESQMAQKKENINIKVNRQTSCPRHINIKSYYNNTEEAFDINFESNNRIQVNSEDNYIWYRGSIYDNLQLLFTLPMVFDHFETLVSCTKLISVFVPHAKDVTQVLVKKTEKESPYLCYELISPINAVCEYDANDLLLIKYIDNISKIRIERV